MNKVESNHNDNLADHYKILVTFEKLCNYCVDITYLFENMNIYNILRYLFVISSAISSSPRSGLLRASTSVDQYA